MYAETLKALEGSISKWEAIVAGVGADDGVRNCPLCQLFFFKDCIGCPVAQKTGLHWCEGSPYGSWAAAAEAEHDYEGNEWRAATPELIVLAQAELDFLRGLQ